MNNIPHALKLELKHDPFYEKCCLENDECEYEQGHRRIEWHHALIYAGRQVQKKWAIVPACSGYHHKYADNPGIKERIMRIVLSRATEEDLRPFFKAINYVALKKKYESKRPT